MIVGGDVTWEPAIGGFMALAMSAIGTRPAVKAFFFHGVKFQRLLGMLVV